MIDRTECVFLSEETDHEHRYQSAENSMLNSISLKVLQAGIPCWDRDVKRYVESVDWPGREARTYQARQRVLGEGKRVECTKLSE